MTKDKARKRVVRARMSQTGERYTSAKMNVARPVVADPGMSDEAIRRGSGRSWAQWYRILDAWGANERTHTEIARHVHDVLGVDGWWSQAVAVGYERARGMRARHQQTDGFRVSVSKTFPVSATRLFQAFVEPRVRNRWLERGTLRVRTSLPFRSARFDVENGRTRLIANFTSKGPKKASVQLEHQRLDDARAVEVMRALWKERFAALAETLSEG